jgi:hypothetical protein
MARISKKGMEKPFFNHTLDRPGEGKYSGSNIERGYSII